MVDPVLPVAKEKHPLVEFLQSIVIAIAICVVMYIFFATPNQVEGVSMKPTFENGQIILTNKVSQWLGPTDFGRSLGLDYNRGDIVVFQKPGYNDFIKRIIGMPGDEISIKDGSVYINGSKLDEPYLSSDVVTYGGTFIKEGAAPMLVPANQYAVMGDNRNNSHDSRFSDIGFINRNWMKGKVLLRYWPLDKLYAIPSVEYNNVDR